MDYSVMAAPGAHEAQAELDFGPSHRQTTSAAQESQSNTVSTKMDSNDAPNVSDSASPAINPTIHRTSSASQLNERSTTSPRLTKKNSRSSLGAREDSGEKRLTPKRSITNLISGLRGAQTMREHVEEEEPLTASRLATEHFAKELNHHALPETNTETVVILHDACYGHRYSRSKTNKTMLSMIVERPERIHASVLGASTAYVRLGGHHTGARNPPHPESRSTPPPFKIRRTSRSLDVTSLYVTNVHGTEWMSELRTLCNAAGERLAAGAKELSRSSSPTDPSKRQLHEGDLYLCSESLNAFQGALGGVADAVDAVFDQSSNTKRAFVAVRPPGHHCSADFPSGFCWLNNVHVGIEYAAQTYGLTHAVILDFDLHHGDGSQAITWERNSRNNILRQNAKPHSKLRLGPDIGYYSLHDINSYPCEMGDDEKVQAASLCIENAHGQSIWNVHLQPWKTERDFWELYETQYRVLLEKARRFLSNHTARLRNEGRSTPKAAIFVSAGFDASEWEGAGMQRHKVNVPTEFYARFTRDIVELSNEDGTGCDERVISVLEGGYSDRALCSGVLSHLSGLCATPVDTLKAEGLAANGLDDMMRGLAINSTAKSTTFHYNKAWWSPANLTALEMKINPPLPPQVKKARIGQQPTYATPTESFAYKVVDADKFARSISGTMREVQPPPRAPTPPLPEVDWVLATQELSKLLIPIDRQTKSCTPEELAGPKVKKEFASALYALSLDEIVQPRQLRDRKTKSPAHPGSTHSDEIESVRSVSRSSRRQTIQELPSSTSQPELATQRRASRRMSAGSALSSLADLDNDAPPVPLLPASTNRTQIMMPPPQAPAQPMQVKKIRAPTKKEPNSSVSASPRRAAKPTARLSGPPAVIASPSNNDVDALTSGMKKVTLKVGSKEEHDRKQKEKLDADRKARAIKAAETRKANAAAKKVANVTSYPIALSQIQQASVGSERPITDHSGFRPIEDHTPQSADSSLPIVAELSSKSTALSGPRDPITAPLLSSHNIIEALQPSTQQIPLPATFEVLGPADHSQHEGPHSQAMREQQSWSALDGSLPQAAAEHRGNVNSNSPIHASVAPMVPRSPSGAKLPVWSSTGVIPFGTTNAKPGPQAEQLSLATTGAAQSDPKSGNVKSLEQPTMAVATSIWDVPATPKH